MKHRFLLFLLALCLQFLHAQHLADVVGYRLDVLQAGRGNATVLFEAGVTDTMTSW